MKYTIAAIINLLFGSLQILLASWQLFLVIPRLKLLYSDFGVDIQGNLTYAYLLLGLVLLFGAVHLFLGIKNLSPSPNKEKYFKYGIILAVTTFFLFVVAVQLLVAGSLLPIYNLIQAI